MAELTYIPMTACEDRKVYKLRARQLRIGVYNAETRAFIGIRRKFTQLFLDEEYHYDVKRSGAVCLFGTAKPLEVIGDAPAGIPIATHLDVNLRNAALYAFLQSIDGEP